MAGWQTEKHTRKARKRKTLWQNLLLLWLDRITALRGNCGSWVSFCSPRGALPHTATLGTHQRGGTADLLSTACPLPQACWHTSPAHATGKASTFSSQRQGAPSQAGLWHACFSTLRCRAGSQQHKAQLTWLQLRDIPQPFRAPQIPRPSVPKHSYLPL